MADNPPRHDHRGTDGRFAPHPPAGDASVYESVDDPSARPGEDEHAQTVYRHDPARGPVMRRIEPRHAIMINAETGERIAYEVDHELRGIDTLYGGGDLRLQAHLQAAGYDPLARNLMQPMIGPETRSSRRTSGADGYRLPAMGQSDAGLHED